MGSIYIYTDTLYNTDTIIMHVCTYIYIYIYTYIYILLLRYATGDDEGQIKKSNVKIDLLITMEVSDAIHGSLLCDLLYYQSIK